MPAKKFPFAKEGYPFVAIAAAISILSLVFTTLIVLHVITIALTLFVVYFFRDPNRQVVALAQKKTLISPADGRVVIVRDNGDGTQQISIFLSVFNVHVNRFPIDSTITKIKYYPGKFLGAWREKASTDNEQTHITLDADGTQVIVKQIAGYIARRIIWWVKEKDVANKGHRFGLIRFGSRVDIIVPDSAKLLIKVGDKVSGGITVLGDLA
jgi:phosphatidylserine decarboxylase